MEPRGQIECPICGVGAPHYHDPETVELERYARPAFEEWVQSDEEPFRSRLCHIGKDEIGKIAVHYGATLPGVWNRRHHSGYYLENGVECAWQAFATAWLSSDAMVRRPQIHP